VTALRFLVDESTGAAVVEYLRACGYDVLAVAEIMFQADDPDILTRAVQEQRILLTNDKDFGDLVFRSGRAHYGVVLLRLRDEHPDNRIRVLLNLLESHADRLEHHFTVATERGVRVRPIDKG
jgi:predicted nuclease of predicted toxin-antitoxin system